MFGLDFSELMVILVIALIVIGPERLPAVARTFGHLYGRLQRYIRVVKTDIAHEMAAEEFRQLQQKIQQEVMGAEQAANQVTQALEQQVRQPGGAMPQPAEQPAAQATPAVSQQAQPETPAASGQKKSQ